MTEIEASKNNFVVRTSQWSRWKSISYWERCFCRIYKLFSLVRKSFTFGDVLIRMIWKRFREERPHLFLNQFNMWALCREKCVLSIVSERISYLNTVVYSPFAEECTNSSMNLQSTNSNSYIDCKFGVSLKHDASLFIVADISIFRDNCHFHWYLRLFLDGYIIEQLFVRWLHIIKKLSPNCPPYMLSSWASSKAV